MKNVHILPPDIVAKIAAGEVIDRPASVLKELIENALDAQAQSIEIQLTQAGKTLIRIKDSGTGIAEEDLAAAFQRHATSKIQAADDLFNIHSLGFRGEALYSVAAVADVVLRSKTADQDSGWEIHMRGGEQLGLKPVAMADGTEIEVRELFFNTPARRKFLKANTTELNQVLNILIPYTLLYPQIRFLLTHGDKTLLDVNPTPSQRDRIAEVLNLKAEHLLEVQHELSGQDVSVKAILGDINITRARRDLQFLFINNRPVQSKTLGFHMNHLYRLVLPPGNFPFFALFLYLPPQDVDVNIHPTKREVKIHDEQALAGLVRHLCENALMSGGQAKQAAGRAPARPGIVPRPEPGERADPDEPPGQTAPLTQPDRPFPAPRNPDQVWEPAAPSWSRPATEQYAFPRNEFLSPAGETLWARRQDSLQDKLEQAAWVGAFRNKYLLFEAGATLLVIDQHAAQERITFEQLIAQMEKGQVEVQHLLSPHLVELSPQEVLAWEESQAALDDLGFATTQFDAQTIAIQTTPVLIKDPVQAMRELLAGGQVARSDHEALARRACRSSVMAGDRLTPQQAQHIRERLLACRDPYTCPHGRPTVVEMSAGFLDKQFLRT